MVYKYKHCSYVNDFQLINQVPTSKESDNCAIVRFSLCGKSKEPLTSRKRVYEHSEEKKHLNSTQVFGK